MALPCGAVRCGVVRCGGVAAVRGIGGGMPGMSGDAERPFAAAALGYGLTDCLTRLRDLCGIAVVAPPRVPILGAAVYTGVFVAVVSNGSYQILQGLVERGWWGDRRALLFVGRAGRSLAVDHHAVDPDGGVLHRRTLALELAGRGGGLERDAVSAGARLDRSRARVVGPTKVRGADAAPVEAGPQEEPAQRVYPQRVGR